ncbi:MAG TPA: ribosome biogenesis GTPase Der [candidate division Zixibacteria bacterium]|nr:ribosome biogenesis GTPase Der [candidate division Zixibacteria bacterium]
MGLPVVAIVGRPNVGKSTLFNRLSKSNAVVDDTPGVTRDRNYSVVNWGGREFIIVDTGGLVTVPRGEMELNISKQAEIAAAEADIVLFLAEKIITHEDAEIAQRLRRGEFPLIFAVNKVDKDKDEQEAVEGWRLAIGDPHSISAKNGRGVADLLDNILLQLPEGGKGEEPHAEIRIAIVGKPNVGKSSFVNKLLGEEKIIVDTKPGTTRDPIDTCFTFNGRSWMLTDTAGLLKKKQFGIEYYSSLRTVSTIKRSDVVLLLTDAVEGFNQQDKRIAGMAVDFIKGLVIGINKWDLVEAETNTAIEKEREINANARFLNFAPIITLSALTGQRVRKVISLLEKIADERKKRIPTAEFNDFIERITLKKPPPIVSGKRSNFLYATQESSNPPVFVIFCRGAKFVPDSYRRYIMNCIRNEYGFEGVSLKLVLRESRKGRE